MELEFSLDTIQEAAGRFWTIAEGRPVIAFYGPMGAGKTTFINALCKEKKVSSVVNSPTFSIINQYEYPGGHIYHIDLYRLKDEEEAIQAGVEDCLYSGQLCLVEWPGRAAGILPDDVLKVTIRVKDPQTRIIAIV